MYVDWREELASWSVAAMTPFQPVTTHTIYLLRTMQNEMQVLDLVMAAAHLSCELRLSAMIDELYLKWGPL